MQIGAHTKTERARTPPPATSLHAFARLIGAAVCIVHSLARVQENCSLVEIFSVGGPTGVNVCAVRVGWMDGCGNETRLQIKTCLSSGCAASHSDSMISETEQFLPPAPNPRVQFLSLFSPLFFFFSYCNLIFLSIRRCHSTYFLSSLDLTLLPPPPLSSHLSCTVTDPAGNCFESARHFCVVAVYLCWGHGGRRAPSLSPVSD